MLDCRATIYRTRIRCGSSIVTKLCIGRGAEWECGESLHAWPDVAQEGKMGELRGDGVATRRATPHVRIVQECAGGGMPKAPGRALAAQHLLLARLGWAGGNQDSICCAGRSSYLYACSPSQQCPSARGIGRDCQNRFASIRADAHPIVTS